MFGILTTNLVPTGFSDVQNNVKRERINDLTGRMDPWIFEGEKESEIDLEGK